jgi:lysophospholipase L1-like esterase
MICVLEVHDTTGYGDEGAAASLDEAASYWISIANVLKGQENYVVINLGNEPLGNNQQVSANWSNWTANAVRRLRGAGLHHLVMVDGPMWGQDWQNIMRNTAGSVLNADPDHNVVFSIHMYSVYDTAAKVNAYLDAFRNANLPLVVGEFGGSQSGAAADEIMRQAQARGLGYIGWSWSGNGGGNGYLDMTVNFDPSQLTAWGQRFLNGANGVRQTSKEAAIFGTTAPPTAAATRIMPLGDSITGSPGCWRALLWKHLLDTGHTNIDFVGTLPAPGCGFAYDGNNEGHGGYLATNIARNNQLPGWLSATHPDIVLMHLGTNDVWSNIAPSSILNAYTTLLGQMRASNPHIKLVVARILPMNPQGCSACAQRVVALNNVIPAWAQSHSTATSPITVVDQWTGFSTSQDTIDGVHPNSTTGIQKMESRWYPALVTALQDANSLTTG